MFGFAQQPSKLRFPCASAPHARQPPARDSLLWSFSGDGQLCTSPVVAGAGGRVFVGSMSGNVHELDEATGKQISVNKIDSAVTCSSESSSMALAEGHLLVPATNELVVY